MRTVRLLRTILLVAGAVGMSGCMAILSRTGIDSGAVPEDPGFFAGTRTSCWVIGDTLSGGAAGNAVLLPFVVVDLPLTVVADSLFVPHEAYRKVRKGTAK
jgi:uncharacterized protein YceK